jgi:hypothetical protein
MTRAQTIMTALLTRALETGEVELRGEQLYQDGRPVMPRLVFVAEQQPATSTAAAGIRPASGEQHEENDNTYPRFAPLPEDRLVPAEKATADRARMAQQRQASAWPGAQFAPLPQEVLVSRRKNDRDDHEEG